MKIVFLFLVGLSDSDAGKYWEISMQAVNVTVTDRHMSSINWKIYLYTSKMIVLQKHYKWLGAEPLIHKRSHHILKPVSFLSLYFPLPKNNHLSCILRHKVNILELHVAPHPAAAGMLRNAHTHTDRQDRHS